MRLSKLVTLCKLGKVYFHSLGTNGFHVRAKAEIFSAVGSRYRQNLKSENFTSSLADYDKKIAPKSVLHVQHDHFPSYNQSNHWFVELSSNLSNVIGGMKENKCAARAARILEQRQIKITTFALFRGELKQTTVHL